MTEIIIPKSLRGLWFYGLAGSGKTFASMFLRSFIARSFVIDGDVVRRFVSADLAYAADDRVKQINRIFGIGMIAIENSMFPIMSSVSMNEDLISKCSEEKIEVIQIERPLNQLKTVRNLYDGENNVVGVDLPLAKLETLNIANSGTSNFETLLTDYVKSISS
tara:strand:- start:4 stop:492 length:489 start_codon:yes stop_codon:yes gene_type:complete